MLVFTLLLSQRAMVCAGELRLSRHYDDNMVLQRATPVLTRGFADKGAEVTVNFSNQTRKPKADGNGLPAVEFNTDAHDYPKNIRTLGQGDRAQQQRLQQRCTLNT